MTTKEQERKVLEQIKKIVDSLGENSYVGTAFAGCFEIAAENIENDFACSMQERWLSADRKLNEANGIIEHLKDELAESKKDYEAAHAAAHAVADEKDAKIAKLKARISELLADNETGSDCIIKLNNSLVDAQNRVEAAENEVVRLKAKLYDYMTAGA